MYTAEASNIFSKPISFKGNEASKLFKACGSSAPQTPHAEASSGLDVKLVSAHSPVRLTGQNRRNRYKAGGWAESYPAPILSIGEPRITLHLRTPLPRGEACSGLLEKKERIETGEESRERRMERIETN